MDEFAVRYSMTSHLMTMLPLSSPGLAWLTGRACWLHMLFCYFFFKVSPDPVAGSFFAEGADTPCEQVAPAPRVAGDGFVFTAFLPARLPFHNKHLAVFTPSLSI